MAEVSTKPYLVRAIYEWCADNGYRPFIAVAVDERTLVPREFVRNGEIVLNISAEATNRLHIGNELLEFEARFGGVARHVSIPIDNVSAIFAQETGHGMAFEVPAHARHAAQGHEADEMGEMGEAGDGAPAEAAPEASQQSPAEAAPQAAKRDRRTGAAHDEAPPAAEAEEKGRTPGKRTAAKRARKTVLRDVSAPASGGDSVPSAASDAKPDADRAAKPRSRKPVIASVPDDEAPEKKGEASPSPAPGKRPDGDDDGPRTPPRGRPRLTRVK